ncbi:MAG: hypothetical protein HYX67_06510, partial [Candidatus Melainabacteria bacterium]|nr:hypothetical protein [Candidatus Melainabacteria bacterium]
MRRAARPKPKATQKSDFDCFQVSTAAHQMYRNKDYKNAAKLYLSHKKDLEKLGNKSVGAAYAYWLLGISLYMCERYVQCEFYLLKSARIYKSLKMADYLNCMWWRGTSFQKRKQFKKAAVSFNSASKWAIANDSQSSDWPCRALSQIGFCLWQVKDFDGAFNAFEKCLALSSNASLNAVSSLLEKVLLLLQSDLTDPSRVPHLRKLAERAIKIVSRKLTQLPKPTTELRPVQDRRFGHVISDPYRWLEDIHSDEVRK